MSIWENILLAIMIYLAVASLVRIEEEHRWRTSLTAFRLQLPADVDTEQAGRWIGTLAGMASSPWWPLSIPRWWPVGMARWPVTVELVATSGGVQRVLIIPDRMVGQVLASLAAVMPGVRAEELSNYCASRRSGWRLATELRLTGRRQLLDTRRAPDTARQVLAALQPLNSGEQIRVQWIIAATRPSWRARHNDQRRDKDHPPTALILRWRTAHPMLSATCRICIDTGTRVRARHLLGRVFAALRGMNTVGGYLARRRGRPGWWTARRATRWALPLLRWPFTLTSPELGALLGLVSSHDLLGVPGAVARTLPPSPATPTEGLVIAASNHPGTTRTLCLQQQDRLRHLWMIGPTGVGKSTLLANLINYDIRRGYGVIAIDARGDLITDVLARVPDDRADEVIVVDPTTTDHPVGFNPLASPHQELAAGFVLHVLHSIYADSWGPRTADVLRASLLTLAHAHPVCGGRYTLCELPELLTNPGFRRRITTQPLPAGVGEFWRWYENLSDRERLHVIAPVLNKLRAFTLSTPLRLLLGQSQGLDFTDVFTQRRIVLVPLKKGLLGAETTALIGSLLVAAVWQTTLARADIPADQRHPVWLYADEFQDVVRLPIDMADMLAQARGLGLGLTLAHQYLNQLSPDIKAAVLGTARSQLVFQLEYEDAKYLASRFAPLTVHDLAGLTTFDIALRPCIGGSTLAPVTGHTYPLPAPTRDPAQLAQASRNRYGHPRHQIEAQLAARSHTPAVANSAHPNRVPLPHDSHP
ncbi:MAG: type IV secretion system DNA-binding domain-containing protein [Pseudonocardiales bacterium]|nr:type IV secretion system DNA-binding domain-containing protein [Pseudonocardiales bacterium]